MPAAVAAKSQRRKILAGSLLLVFAVFVRTIWFDFVWDDWLVLVQNPRMTSSFTGAVGYYFTHVAWNLYMPVTCAVWAALAWMGHLSERAADGSVLNPYVFHLASVLLHVASAAAVFRLLARLFESFWPALLGALLFALHPIQVEAASFIGAMNTPLAALFSFLAITDYLRAVKPNPLPETNLKWAYSRAIFFLIIAMLCKPTAVVVPLMAAVLDRAVYKHNWRAIFRASYPLMLAVIPCIAWTTLNQRGRISAASIPPAFRVLVACDSIATTSRHVLWPFGLTIDYGRTPAFVFAHQSTVAIGITITLLLVGSVIAFRRRLPVLSAGLAIFLIGLLPNSGLAPFDFQQYSTVADRYAYFAMLGPAIIGGWLLMQCLARNMSHRIIAGCSFAVLAALAFLAIQQSGYWQDDVTLFTHAVETNPGSWLAHASLAYGLLKTNPAAAEVEARIAVSLHPSRAENHTLLANALFANGDKAGAMRELQAAAAAK